MMNPQPFPKKIVEKIEVIQMKVSPTESLSKKQKANHLPSNFTRNFFMSQNIYHAMEKKH